MIQGSLPHHLGMVATAHGMLETSFRSFYQACESAAPEEKDKHASRLGLKKIANAVIRKCAVLFEDEPEIATLFSNMSKHVKAYEIRRNIALHGGYFATFPKIGGVNFSIIGRYNDSDVIIYFDEQDIVQLWHDILSIDGCFTKFFGDEDFPLLTSSQTQIARDRLLPHHRPQSSPPTHPRLPISSLW